MKYPHKTCPPPPPSPLGDIATAKTSSVLTQGSNTSIIIKEVSLQHHETIKDAMNLYSWQAQRQRASEGTSALAEPSSLSQRVGEEGGVVCLCMRMCVFVHSRLKKKGKSSRYEGECDSSGSGYHAVSHWESMNYLQSFKWFWRWFLTLWTVSES